jgi:thioredoxin reductase
LDATYDVVVVGGGAAGLSGPLALGRARRTVLVVDAGDARNSPAGHVHNYLTSEGVAPSALLATGRAEVAPYGVQVVGATVVGLRHLTGNRKEPSDEPDGHRFEVDLADGRSVRSRRLLVATGLVDELPEVPGVAERWGRDVLHCPYCHGWEVRDRAVGILGTGPSAVHGALLWRQWSANVVLFRHTSPTLSEEQTEQLTARGIEVVEGEVMALEVEDDRLAGVRLRSGEVVPRQAVVVALGSRRAPGCWPPWAWMQPTRRSPVTSSAAPSPATPPGPPRSRGCGLPATSPTRSPRSSPPPPPVCRPARQSTPT